MPALDTHDFVDKKESANVVNLSLILGPLPGLQLTAILSQLLNKFIAEIMIQTKLDYIQGVIKLPIERQFTKLKTDLHELNFFPGMSLPEK